MTARLIFAASLCLLAGCTRVPAGSRSPHADVAARAGPETEPETGTGTEKHEQWLESNPSAVVVETPPEPETARAVPAPEETAERARILFIEGQKLFRIGDFAGAAQRFEHALALAPDRWQLAFNAAQAWARAGDCVRALPMFQHALASADPSAQGSVRSAMEQRCGSTP